LAEFLGGGKMMLATILLMINFSFLLFKNEVLFGFINFLWIYPAEIIFYVMFYIIIYKVLKNRVVK
jgi:hypothetical protein